MAKGLSVSDVPQDDPIDFEKLGRNGLTDTGDQYEHGVIEKDMSDPALESFMNEMVEIVLAESNADGDVAAIPLTVNGITQYAIRGVPIEVKRKYVEVLLRGRTTKYKQELANPNDQYSGRPMPKTAPSYPFQVTRDTPKGMAWAKEIRDQRF